MQITLMLHSELRLIVFKKHCGSKTRTNTGAEDWCVFPNVFAVVHSLYITMCLMCVAESRCILLPVVLRVLQAHMQEQRDLVMCARILTSMLSLIKKEENGTAVSISVLIGCNYRSTPTWRRWTDSRM